MTTQMQKISINVQLQAIDLALRMRTELRKKCRSESEGEYLYAALLCARATLVWCEENRDMVLEWRRAMKELDAETPDP